MKTAVSSLLLLALSTSILGQELEDRSFDIPLNIRAPLDQTVEERVLDFDARLERTKRKYNLEDRSRGPNRNKLIKDVIRPSKRSNVQMGDAYTDSSYSATIVIGTPPVAFVVSLDTGSADLILITAPCASGCTSDTPLYIASQSSTAIVTNTPFAIEYTSGGASGVLVSDKMEFAGYTLNSQTFGAVNISTTITGPGGVSGLLGLGNQPLAHSEAIPFVQALYTNGLLASPLFAFAFARWGNQAENVNPGGIMSVGSLDSRFYSGSIAYIPLSPDSVSQGYWNIPMSNVIVNGQSVAISTTAANIDTGTTNILFPYAAAAAFYSHIPGSATNGKGRYTYPCATQVNTQFVFGGIAYAMSAADFNGGYATQDGVSCIGAISGISQDSGGDIYIIGDSFLKNVYSVFRYSPYAVGFGTLVDTNGLLESGTVPVGNATNAAGYVAPQPIVTPVAAPVATPAAATPAAVGIAGLASILQNALIATISNNVRNGVLAITCPAARINRSTDLWTCNA